MVLCRLDEASVHLPILREKSSQEHVLLRKVFVERIRHSTQRKLAASGKVGLSRVDKQWPHARQQGAVLLIGKVIGDALDYVEILWVSR